MVKEKFYITTAIDYVNAAPHIGHAYQKIVADTFARWNKLLGKKVYFLTGTDEHGKKVQTAAEKAGKTPKKFVDEISKEFKKAWKVLNIKPTRFIRTTDQDHQDVVKEFIQKSNRAGDIYKGHYEGYYCVGCEAYYTEQEYPDLKCPIHKKPLEKLKEESYFFRLSKYKDFLLDLYKKDPKFIQPEKRKNEIISRVSQGLNDLSISRTSFDWGISFPLDKKHVVYVWFDALINYYTPEKTKRGTWPADAHLLGKDNTWFHTVYWPAMLKSAGIRLPKTTLNHGFLSFNGQKISKSLGNTVSPITLVEKYSADSVRYFCLRQFPFAEGDDGNFEEAALIERHNSELADKFGNLVSRVTSLAEKEGIQKTQNKLLKKLNLRKIKLLLENYEPDKALNEIFAFIDNCNEYVQNKKPWQTKDKKVLYELVDSIKAIAILLWPFIPSTSEKIAKQLNFKFDLKEINKPLKRIRIKKSPILFEKIENKNINKQTSLKQDMEGVANIVEFQDWEKLNLKIGEIEQVEDVPGADKLYKLIISLGDETKTVCAGIKKFYSHDDLKGRRIILFTNLKPRQLKGITSEGMVLAAVNKDETKVSLIQPDDNTIELGSRVS